MKRHSACKTIGFIAFLLLSTARTTHARWGTSVPTVDPKVSHVPSSLKLPMTFEPNEGQLNPSVQFIARGTAYTLLLMGSDIAFVPNVGSPHSVIYMSFVNGSKHPSADGLGLQSGRKHYLVGDTASQWRTGIPLYGAVAVHNIYRDIDAVFYGRDQQLEYDLILQPGADPSQINLRFDGVSSVCLTEGGDLLVRSPAGEMVHRRPQTYQIIDGVRLPLEGAFVLKRENEVSFEVRPIREDMPVVIDPVITYSSYLGGSSEDVGLKIRTDPTGAIYVMGRTGSFRNFPGAGSAFGTVDIQPVAFITKLAPDGNSVVYSLLFGSLDGGDLSLGGFAVDSLGQTYLAGGAVGHVPTTPNAFQPTKTPGSRTAFVAKFDPSGSQLIYSTYLGGTRSTNTNQPNSGDDNATGLAVDASGNAYIAGFTRSTDFPLKHPFQPTGGGSAFLSKLNATGSDLIFSTYLGNHVFEDGINVAVDTAENVYITGRTVSPNFPVTPGALQTEITTNTGPGGTRPASDAFITKFDPSGTALVFSTFFGGPGADGFFTEVINAISVDSSSNIYLTGWTDSFGFPQAGAPPNTFCGPAATAFFAKIDSSGSRLVYSWCEGLANGPGEGVAIAPDSAGNAYTAFFNRLWRNPGNTVVVRKLSPIGQIVAEQQLRGSGGEAPFDLTLFADHIAYLTGETLSTDLPTVRPFQRDSAGGGDAFVAAIDFSDQPATGTFTRIEQDNSAVTYTGVWNPDQHSILSGGSALTSLVAGSRATFNFNGSAARWIGLKDAWSGIANVYVDGTFRAQVDLYSPSDVGQPILYTVTGLTSAPHTLTVEVTATRNALSQAAWVWIDAFEYAPGATMPGSTP